MSKRTSVFSAMMATRAKKTSSLSPITTTIDDNAPGATPAQKNVTIEAPESRSQFKRVNVPSITGIGNQIWRRVKENKSTDRSSNDYRVSPPVRRIIKVPDLTSTRKNTARSKSRPTRIDIRHPSLITDSKVRSIIKDLIE